MLRPVRRVPIAWSAAICLALGLAACREAGSQPDPAPASQESAVPVAAKAEEAPARRAGERPLPAFEGRMLDGEQRSISSFIGRRLLIFFFNPEIEDAKTVARAVASVATQQQEHNFSVVGVAVGSTAERARRFASETGLDVPIFDDSSARISRSLGLRSPMVLLGVDPEGYLDFGMGSFATDSPDAVQALSAQLRQQLRLPEPDAEATGALDQRPRAPLFQARLMRGDAPFRLADHANQPVILVFFLHTCPHCHQALHFFKGELAKLPAAQRPFLLGISVEDRPASVGAMLREKGLDFFPVAFDPTGSIRSAYGVFGGVPDIVLIAPDGRISHRVRGWREDRDPGLVRMVMAKISGRPVPMLLSTKGYTGSDVCGVCHELEHETWEFTAHSGAFDTLVEHAAANDAECVSCHVVGFGKPGGWSFEQRERYLEDVGCEVCHGRGGPHLSPNFVHDDQYQGVCLTCHNPTHSLGFDYESFLPRISHAAIAALSSAQRATLVADRRKPRDLLPTSSRIVGSEACQSCHPAEYATWSKSAHAHAVASLEKKGKAEDADCLRCHTTGFGRPGGFPADAGPAAHPDLARVGCESCHGPGGDHVAQGSKKIGSIVSLGDKCDSCVILQICGSCHDDENDPGFRFRVKARIEKQRHGTIEAGTGKPLSGDSAARARRPERLLAEAFARLGRGE
jgi:peroxiredoxin